jgi:hypothetical protein
MSNITQAAKKSMLLIGTLLLVGCVSAPTLDFSIPVDKIEDFNKCMVSGSLEKLGKNQSPKEFWHGGLSKVFISPKLTKLKLHTPLFESIPEILNMLYADKERLEVPKGAELLSVPFDMYSSPFPFFDSRIVNVLEKIIDSASFFQLLQMENIAQADINKVDMTIPERTAILLKAYLLAYFTVRESSEKINGFVSRDGTKFQFPIEINSISGNKIQAMRSLDHSQVGADIIRIFLEAVRDGSLSNCEGIPAIDKSATGVKVGLLRFYADDACSKKWKITFERLNIIQTHANAAESMIATAAGKAIRGGVFGALNNEALARAVETAIGVMARHTTEQVEWCKARKE